MTWAITAGDARTVLAGWPAGRVQTICTSPPYWSQRAYGTHPQIWGGDPACDHAWGTPLRGRVRDHQRLDQLGARLGTGGGHKMSQSNHTQPQTGAYCTRCSAWLGELGSEPTVDQYCANLAAVLRPARRALHTTGTLFLNLGDSFSNAGRAGDRGTRAGRTEGGKPGWTAPDALGDKQLMLVPFRAAMALQADGWILRQVIPWVKGNARPESAADRPNTSLEYVFLFSRSARYYFDMAAVQQYLAIGRHWRNGDFLTGPGGALVFDIATQPAETAHFAVMPERLAEACILAGSRPGDVVADPFTGAGTVGKVAVEWERDFWGAELSAEYCAMARNRIAAAVPYWQDARRTPMATDLGPLFNQATEGAA